MGVTALQGVKSEYLKTGQTVLMRNSFFMENM